MSKIAGVDVLVYVNTGTAQTPTYTVLGGQTGATLNRSTNVIETTSKDANGWAENVAGVNSWSIDCDGYLVAGDNALAKMEDIWHARGKVKVEIRVPSGNKYTGDAIISDFPAEFPTDGGATFSISFTGTGALAKTTNN